MDYKKLSQNIKNLRHRYGESQDELSSAINCTLSTIAMIETDARKPSREILIKLANHFRVTVDQLLYSEITPSLRINFSSYDVYTMSEISNSWFPVIESENANQNTLFRTAYALHLQFRAETSPTKDILEQLISLYDKCIDAGVTEAIVNYLSLIMSWGIIIKHPEFKEPLMKLSRGKLDVTDFFKNHYLKDFSASEDMKQEETESEIHDFIEVIFEFIKEINKVKEYPELVAFFSAERYIFGYIDNGLSDELNSSIGFEMMCEIARLGNPYARDVLLNIKNISDNDK